MKRSPTTAAEGQYKMSRSALLCSYPALDFPNWTMTHASLFNWRCTGLVYTKSSSLLHFFFVFGEHSKMFMTGEHRVRETGLDEKSLWDPRNQWVWGMQPLRVSTSTSAFCFYACVHFTAPSCSCQPQLQKALRKRN